MRAKDSFCTVFNKIFNRRQCAENPAFIADIKVFIKGNVEINANEYALAFTGTSVTDSLAIFSLLSDYCCFFVRNKSPARTDYVLFRFKL
mgnify:CR=1 FL=1